MQGVSHGLSILIRRHAETTPPDAARHRPQASRPSGMPGRVIFRLMDSLIQDVRYALATLRRNPGFAVAGLLTVALGIGATTAVYSVLHGVLLKPLPYPNPERLVRLWEEHPGGTTAAGQRWLSHLTYYAWLDRATTLDDMGAYASMNTTFGSATSLRASSAPSSRRRPSACSARRRRSGASSGPKRPSTAQNLSSSSAIGCGANATARTLVSSASS